VQTIFFLSGAIRFLLAPALVLSHDWLVPVVLISVNKDIFNNAPGPESSQSCGAPQASEAAARLLT
jgi:hypothetical protein